MNFGENIYKLRTQKNWSQTDLANELEVSRQSVSKWENNTAVPDLDRLIRMSTLFEVSIDDIVFGNTQPKKKDDLSQSPFSSTKNIIGLLLMVFGMTLFLLSIFWGDHLYFGEAFGELFSIIIVLLSLSLLATYNFKIISLCAVIYFLYTFISFAIFNITSTTNYIFIFISGLLITSWFITYGMHETQNKQPEIH